MQESEHSPGNSAGALFPGLNSFLFLQVDISPKKRYNILQREMYFSILCDD